MLETIGGEVERQRILLGLLESVERDGTQSQRRLATELGIALGLVNAYLKRCVKKGLLKVHQAPARRYAYYLTPRGAAEKSRLTIEYLAFSFGFFRQAKTDCSELLAASKTRGVKRVVLAGQSDLAEIAALCAIQQGVEIVGVVDAGTADKEFIGLPVFDKFESVELPFDAVLIADLGQPRETYDAAIARFGVDRVLVPGLLRIGIRKPEEAAA